MRPKNIDVRVPKTLSLDLDVYREFEKIVGAGNISDEIRAFMKDRVEQAKNEQGLKINPLNLKSCSPTQRSDNNKQANLFEHFDTIDMRNEIRLYINNIMDITQLETLRKNCNVVVSMVETRKEQNRAEAMAILRKEHKTELLQTEEEITRKIRKEQRREFAVRRV